MASDSISQKISEAANKFPKPEGKVFQYGTAGFRMNADLLDSVVHRVGLLASLRSRKLNGATIGVMITASHNPPHDNGVKLVDPMGEMLEASWEKYATQLANAENTEALLTVYNGLAAEMKVNASTPSNVIYARDTRASGARLVNCLVAALDATETKSTDYKISTTPQLHYYTCCLNTAGTEKAYGEPSEKGYYQKMADAYVRAMKHVAGTNGHITVDCANGVGGPKLNELLKYLPQKGQDKYLDVRVINDDVHKPDNLNVQCGADFVKTQQRAPPSSKVAPLDRCASLDGDADRVVYYFLDKDSQFRLLDGDRIATLAASFLADLGRQSGLADSLRIGIVQTAYANGSSTAYVTQNLKLPIVCTPTGVKHLHHAAGRFDIGVYFEANGHGTILFSEAAQKAIRTAEPQSPAQQAALETLAALADLINQTVGDAISDMLLVEVVLAYKGWGCPEWLGTYTDLPNRLVRVEVGDRNLFKAVDAERKLEEPKGCQAQIDAMVGKFTQARSFARASGTEDAVRVYAEAATRSEADDLAQGVAGVVRSFGGAK